MPRWRAGGRPILSRPPRGSSTYCPWCVLLARMGRSFLRKLLLQRFEAEARTLLQRRELEKGLRVLRYLLLHKDEAPELVYEPVLVEERAGQARALERIQTEVDEDRPIDLDRATQPTVRLVDEPVLEVADAHRAERRFREIEDLVTLRRSLAGDQVQLVVTVEIELVGAVTEL